LRGASACPTTACTTTTGTEREDDLDVVAVVIPNNTHFEIASAFLEKGTVVCEKPLTNDSETAAQLVALDGLIGVRFVEAAVTSHTADAAWVTMD
jgi:predicted dehydrogenase